MAQKWQNHGSCGNVGEEGEKRGFFTWTNKAVPKVFQENSRVGGLCMLSEVTVIKKTGTTSYKWEQWLSISSHGIAGMNLLWLFANSWQFCEYNWLLLASGMLSERPSNNLETYAIIFPILSCNRTCMTFIIGATVTVMALTSTDKWYKMHSILQGFWFGVVCRQLLHFTIKISAWKRGKKTPMANLFNGSDAELFPKENSLWIFISSSCFCL